MANICVFCGSGVGNNPKFKSAAETLGRLIAENGHSLVFGGGKVGLMGVIANAVLDHGGAAVGVIPKFLMDREVGHEGLSELFIVDSMHERKLMMANKADAFIAMPGGLGTLEELAEISTWAQLNIMDKPIGILNVEQFYQHLEQQLEKMVAEGFMRSENKEMLKIASQPADLLKLISSHLSTHKSQPLDQDKS
ncbi:MAG: TIGR00730 family Rossman fold protein [Bacteroidota bacterium]